MAKFFIVLAACVALVGASSIASDNDLVRIRSKRGGYIQQHKVDGAAAGGQRIRGPAAVLSGGGGGSYAPAGAAYGSAKRGGASGAGYGSSLGGSLGGLGGGDLYSYAPRGASAAVYGGAQGPSTHALFAGRNLYAGHGGLIPAAIQSRRQIQFYDVPSAREDAEPLTIEVGSSPASLLNFKFRSSSSPINVDQDHEPSPGSVRETSSEDEPHRLIHTVTRPIFQEVHEVIKPFRKVTQEVQPVVEDIQTVVAKGDEITGVSGAGLAGGVRDQGIGGGQLIGGGFSGGPVGGSVVGVSRPSYSTGLTGHGAGPSYTSGYSKPAGYGSGALLGGSRGGHGGGLEQVQLPFARRAAAARRAA